MGSTFFMVFVLLMVVGILLVYLYQENRCISENYRLRRFEADVRGLKYEIADIEMDKMVQKSQFLQGKAALDLGFEAVLPEEMKYLHVPPTEEVASSSGQDGQGREGTHLFPALDHAIQGLLPGSSPNKRRLTP